MRLFVKLFDKQFSVALLFFIISAVYGVLMRLQKFVSIPDFNYAHFIQAHSHVTFLGWGFIGVTALVIRAFLSVDTKDKITYRIFFVLMLVSLLGLLISFPIQGYKLFSIAFLSIFLLSSYVYLALLYGSLNKYQTHSSRFVKTGIIYYYISSLAIWAVAFISIKYGKTVLYHNAIYFYLHFLYNGFFVFSLFGLFLRYFEENNIPLQVKSIKGFYRFTNWAVIPAYALSLLWNPVPKFVIILGFIAVLLQLISIKYLYRIIRTFSKSNFYKSFFKLPVLIVFASYILKLFLQFLSAFPSITGLAVRYKPFFVIGYIHLFTLGFMSLFILVIYQLLTRFTLSKIGLLWFITGVIGSEILLFTQGGFYHFFSISIPYFNPLLFTVSLLMPVGLIWILIINNSKES